MRKVEMHEKRAAIQLTKKTALFSSSLAFLALLTILLWAPWRDVTDTSATLQSTPSFEAVLPHGRSIDELGGWKKLAPPSGAAVYIYKDTIDGVAINVSQQHLPDSFKKDTESKIADLAKRYNASTALVTDDVSAFIGTSAKGPQSVIFSKGEALVLIKSESVISNQLWTQYLETLE